MVRCKRAPAAAPALPGQAAQGSRAGSAAGTGRLPARLAKRGPSGSRGQPGGRAAGAPPGGDGWIVLGPAGAAPMLFPAPGEITMTPLHDAILDALGGGGALFFRALADRAAASAGHREPADVRLASASTPNGASPAGASQLGAGPPGASRPGPGEPSEMGRAGPPGAASPDAQRLRVPAGRAGDQAVAAAIWDPVWAGRLTNDTRAPPRTMLGAGRPPPGGLAAGSRP